MVVPSVTISGLHSGVENGSCGVLPNARHRPFIVTGPSDDGGVHAILCANGPVPADVLNSLTGYIKATPTIDGPRIGDQGGRPARAAPGNVLAHAGAIEAAVDIARMTAPEADMSCYALVDRRGCAMPAADMEAFAAQHALDIISLSQVLEQRLRAGGLMECVSQQSLDNRWGAGWRQAIYRNRATQAEHQLMILGQIRPPMPVLTLFAVAGAPTEAGTWGKADPSFDLCVRAIAHEGQGVVVIQPPLAPTALMHLRVPVGNTDTMILRDLGPGLEMLRHAGIRRLKILLQTDVRT